MTINIRMNLRCLRSAHLERKKKYCFETFLIHLSENNPSGSFGVFAMKYYLQFVREELVLVSDALD